MLRLFVNSFTADGKYSVLNRDNLTKPIQMQLSHKEKKNSWFFSASVQSRLNFEHFQTKMTLIASVFLNLRSPKSAVKYTSKNAISEYPSTSNMVNALKHCSNLRGGTLSNLSIIAKDNESEKSLLVTCKILRLFAKTLIANDKYSPFNKDNLVQPIQIILSPKKKKTFLDVLSLVSKSRLNFEHFQKKDDPHSLRISEITDSQRRG